ncbi:uncharacterized protein LOC129926281 [Biomphalaria glabrata]|uniref:Uncharacterized protein LOC129926281 n=1 Tax=Biomphalaria glabrata TaxID=6526 RepID=A0A9W3ADJ4_BIOGL|nr:uncharacterized protein LOC129926281 [Biomphalaria glabrata]
MATTKTLDQLLLKELRRELRNRDLKMSGNKETLQARLREDLVKEKEDPDTYLFEVEPDLQEQMAAMQGHMAAMQGQIVSSIQEQMAAMREQMNSGQENTNYKIDKMDSGIKTELLAMNQRIHAVEERITTIEEQMNQRVYAVEKKIEEIKTQVYRDFTKMQKANVMSIVPEAFMKVKPPVFDGSVSWSVYKLQFDAAAKVNQWNSDEEKATALILSLRGKASELLQSIPNPQDYAALVKTMELRYGDEYLSELYRVKLKTRRQQSNETLRELEADIARLAHLAYPTATQDLLEIIITDAFADALRDPELKKAIRVSGKHKASEALVYALLYQAAKDESEKIYQDQRLEVKDKGRRELRKTNEALEKCRTTQIPQGQRGEG